MKSLNTALKQVRRSPYQAFSAITVMAVSFFVIIIFGLVALASQLILHHFETRPQIIAYLKEDVSLEQVNPLIASLKNTGLVKSVKYISKEDALNIYKQSVGNDPLLLGTITDLASISAQILPASIEVTAVGPTDFPKIIDILKTSDLVGLNTKGEKDIDFPQDVVSQLTAWTAALRLAGLILIIAISLTCVFSMSTIISMKIRSRRSEIQTMKLLGAKNAFILNPYLFESTLYSLIGAFVGWIFAYIALLYATPFLASQLQGIIDLPISPVVMLMVLGVTTAFSLLLGLISGIFAGSRVLRSK